MQKDKWVKPLLWLFICMSMCGVANAQLRLPRLCSNGAVLQRDAKIYMWGWATPGASVQIQFKNKQYKGQTDKAGKWQIELPAQPAGGPFAITVKSGKESIYLKDIVFGDVWVCSGQSNMEHDLASVDERYPGLIDTTDDSMIRQFKVQGSYDFNKEHADFSSGNWQPATGPYVSAFTAVGFFFALEIYRQTKVPIGLINASLGGSPIEAWLPEAELKHYPKDYAAYEKFKDSNLIAGIQKADRERADLWSQALEEKDNGLLNNWKKLAYDQVDWKTMSVPGYWEDQGLGLVHGAVWFKKAVFIKASELKAIGSDTDTNIDTARLVLGRMVDADSVFVNGTYVGNTTYLYPRRRYRFPIELLRPGENTITIRIVNQNGKGGFVPDKPYLLVLGKDTLSLAGIWKYKLGAEAVPLAPQTFVRWKPGGLFNAMAAPLFKFPVKGVLWYQGESNADSPGDYGGKLTALINSWRSRWDKPQLPFLYVQLPNYMQQSHEANIKSGWAEHREQQRSVLKLPNTGMAVTTDLGEWNDVHPMDKQDVGKRLAYIAEEKVYQANSHTSRPWCGPILKNAHIRDGHIVLSFDQVGTGLKTRDRGPLAYFAVAVGEGPFQWAKATIHGDEVWVDSDTVRSGEVIRVRYGWANNPLSANLVNAADLPASPFEIIVE
ncbi:MAG TPA: sialate O-acetylesterase [Arachidicoccus sp.]|nr:sialate O-acetylesterase [Arachidicoccus sp.]